MNDRERRDLLFTLSPLSYVRSLGLNLYPWQCAIFESEHSFKIIKGARRAGKSRIISAIPCHSARFYPGSVTLVLAYRLDQAEEDLRYMRKFIAADPDFPKLIRDNDGEIETITGSRMIAVPATEEAARGYPDARKIIIDEAAFVNNVIFDDCLFPMLSGNDEIEIIVISTPHGKSGDPGRVFHEMFNDPAYDRYEIRAPWDIDPHDAKSLVRAEPEKKYQKRMAEKGIKAFYSPRHANINTQLKILKRGTRHYRQNCLVEFIEPEDSAFSYDDIQAAASRKVPGLDLGIRNVKGLKIP